MKYKWKIFTLAFLIGLVLSPGALLAQKITTSHGVALFGDLMYGPDFKHFDYVNPDAPKGGLIVQNIDSFDSIHGYITLGTTTGFYVLPEAETFFTLSADEPNSAYGLLAETITYPDDFAWVEYKIRDIARWNDGKPLTAEDALWSWEILRGKLVHPSWRQRALDVSTAEITGPNRIRFTFAEPSPDIGAIYTFSTTFPVFPKHYWATRDFYEPSTEIYVQSTPYKYLKVDVGNTIILKRDPNYWGKDLPVNIGRNNFNIMRLDVYRDQNITYEAFMGGNLDIRMELQPSKWRSGYKSEAVEEGVIQLREDESRGAVMFLGIGMNGRRPALSDVKTREALTYAFDWEWTNKNMFYGMFSRIRSYFSNTELAHEGIPSGKELELLEPYRDVLDPRVFTTPFEAPNTEGTQMGLRKNLRKASQLLKEAGWETKDGFLTRDGQKFSVEFLIQDPNQEATYANFIENMRKLGIDAKLNIVDATTFWPKVFSYDWDMLSNGLFPHSLSPGKEFRDFWGSASAENAMSFNQQYIKRPEIDGLIEAVATATSRPDKLAACRALDRALLYGFHSIPLYFWNTTFLAHWDRFSMPDTLPKWAPFNPQDTWWIDPAKEKRVIEFRREL